VELIAHEELEKKGEIGCRTLKKGGFCHKPLKKKSLAAHTTIQCQFAAGHYNHYNNISSSKGYQHIYKRQVYPYPFTSIFHGSLED